MDRDIKFWSKLGVETKQIEFSRMGKAECARQNRVFVNSDPSCIKATYSYHGINNYKQYQDVKVTKNNTKNVRMYTV